MKTKIKTKNLKIKKAARFTADYLAELIAAGIAVNIFLGDL